jgi:hypothetical protein
MASEIGYDDETHTMTVRWAKSGKTSEYADVPEDKALDCANAGSVGEYINAEIKPYYSHRYI